MEFASTKSDGRLVSLDVFRGITILAMILVNNPGDGDHVWWPLGHAEWNGWTPTDLVFPSFLFIVGTAMAYSLRKYRAGTIVDAAVYWRIFRRTAVLFLLGLVLNGSGMLFSGQLDFSTLRILGVLQRIALVYCAASLLVLHTSVRTQLIVAAALLLGYWGLLAQLPRDVSPKGRMSNTQNIVREVDVAVLGKDHMYTQATTQPTEPEGLLSTLPAIVTALLGYWSGLLIQRHAGVGKPVVQLLLGGAVLVAIALLWNESFPINKKLWTSSFVLLTGGCSMIAFAACLFAFDGLGLKRLARPFEIVGINAIFVYVGAVLLSRLIAVTSIGDLTTKDWIYKELFTSWIDSPVVASHTFAAAMVAFWWIILWLMSRKGWSIRV
ncbi:MAG: heparan-alpha-glucosaminide N-acetyltransferase domain-containing protein [Pirellulales bacterium]